MRHIFNRAFLLAALMTSWAAFHAHAGGAYRLIYGGTLGINDAPPGPNQFRLPGDTIYSLTSYSNFPANPDWVETLGIAGGTASKRWLESWDSFGVEKSSMIEYFFEPPQTGDYIFWAEGRGAVG